MFALYLHMTFNLVAYFGFVCCICILQPLILFARKLLLMVKAFVDILGSMLRSHLIPIFTAEFLNLVVTCSRLLDHIFSIYVWVFIWFLTSSKA